MLSDIKWALRNKWLCLTWIAALFILLRPIMDLFTPSDLIDYDYMMVFWFSMNFSGFAPFAILFCIAPYACSFHDEYRSGYTKSALFHARRIRYIWSKIIAVFCSGAAALAVPFAMIAAISYALFANASIDSMMRLGHTVNTIWEPIFIQYGGLAVLGGKVLLASLFGGIWSLTGLIASCIVVDRLVAVILPYVAYQTVWVLFSRSLYCPTLYLRADVFLIPSFRFVIAIQMAYLALFVAVSFFAMKWRCAHV